MSITLCRKGVLIVIFVIYFTFDFLTKLTIPYGLRTLGLPQTLKVPSASNPSDIKSKEQLPTIPIINPSQGPKYSLRS